MLIFALIFGAKPVNLFAQAVGTESAEVVSEVETAPVVAAEEVQSPDATCVVVEESTAPPKVDVKSPGFKIIGVVVHPQGPGSCLTSQYVLVFPSELFDLIGTPTWATSEGPFPGGQCTVSPEGWTITCPAISAKVIVNIIVVAKPKATGSGAITISRNGTVVVSNAVEVAHFLYLPMTVQGGGRGG